MTGIIKSNNGQIVSVKPTRDATQVAHVVETFKKQGANVLTVASLLEEAPIDHRLVVRVLEFDARRDFFSTGKGKYAPSKTALEAIASALGVQWSPMGCARRDDRSDPYYCEFQATAFVKDSATGEMRTYTATKSYDLRDGSPDAEECSEFQLKQKRRFIVALCDTGARLRVIRQLAPVRNDYSNDEIRKPFVTVSMVYQPGVDTGMANMAHHAAMQAQAAMFGFGAQQGQQFQALPASAPPALPPAQTQQEIEGDLFAEYCNEYGVVDSIEPDLDKFASLPRWISDQIAEVAVELSGYDLAAKLAEAGAKDKTIEELSDSALLRLYGACLELMK
jgi:hypothetical protein